MALTEAEFEQLKANQRAAAGLSAIVRVAPKRSANKWEVRFGHCLETLKRQGVVLWYQFEGMRFRLADGAYYKPDYIAMTASREFIAYEVKGHWREAARVRIKVAAEQHPVTFIAVRPGAVKEGGGWSSEEFSACADRLKGGH